MKIFVVTHEEGGLICAGRSVEEAARRVVEVFRNKFPKEEGYQIRVIAVSIKMSSEVIE